MIQLGIVIACIIAIVGLLHARDHRVVKEDRARVEKLAEKKNEKAQTARTLAADDPLRVLNKSCRDCGKSGSVQIVEGSHSLKK